MKVVYDLKWYQLKSVEDLKIVEKDCSDVCGHFCLLFESFWPAALQWWCWPTKATIQLLLDTGVSLDMHCETSFADAV